MAAGCGRPEEAMSGMRRRLPGGAWLLAAGLALGLVPAAPAADPGVTQGGRAGFDGAPRALASNGAIVLMPEIAGLGCAEMAEVLRLIDESRYRQARPVAPDHPDRPIFDYENRLAGAYYFGCIMGAHRLDDPAPAFAHGFQQP
jgi:hypothetical protein